MKVGFNVEKLIAFAQENANERGYVNFDITPRREVSERGDTHSISLDDWKPNTAQARAPQAAQAAPAPKAKFVPTGKPKTAAVPAHQAPDEEVPF